MCQLFGLNANSPTAATFSFSGFRARGGLTGEHVDGFGLAFHEGGACRVFTDAGRACDSALADFLCRHPIRARAVLAHLRKATQGPVALANCHPFVREWLGREWSFCHNGHLRDYQPRLALGRQPVGETDSEAAFCWLLQQLRRRFRGSRSPGWRELAPVLADLSDGIAAHGTFNFLLCDGEALYAHCSTRLFWLQRRHPFTTAHLVDRDMSLDLATANGPDARMALVATEPLTRNEAWQAMVPGELRVFVDGASVWQRVPAALAPSEAAGFPEPRGPVPALCASGLPA